MKRIIVITAATIITMFTACKKNDNTTSPNNNTSNNNTSNNSNNNTNPIPTFMTATINNVPFSGSLAVFAINSGNLEIDGGNQNTQNTTAVQLLDPYIRLYIDNYQIGSVGAFSFTSIVGSVASGSIDSNSAMGTYVVGLTGTINITSSTASAISGTFNFTCGDSTTVNNGKFTARLN